MRTHLILLSAACLGTSALLFTSVSAADNAAVPPPAPANSVGAAAAPAADVNLPALPAGITAKDLNSDQAIEKMFKGITEYAVDTTGFDNLAGYLAKQDYERVKGSLATDRSLGNVDGNKNKSFSDAVTNLQTSWKAKYGQKFSIDYKTVYGSNLHIQTGEVNDPAQLIGNWPVQASAGTVSAADADTASKKTFGGDVKLEKGRKVAITSCPALMGMPAITASLIDEHGSGWHFDIPNTIKAQQLYDNMVSNLTYINDHQSTWPTDVNEGYRMVTHGVILALYDVDLKKLPMNKTALNQ